MLHVHGFLVLFSFTVLCLGKFIALDKIICSCYYLQTQEVLKEHPRYKKDEKIQGMQNTSINIWQCWGPKPNFIGNKAKGRISKGVFQENKACQIFRKKKRFLPPDTHTFVCVSGCKKCSYVCVSGGKKCYFSENLACFVFLKHPF